MSKHTVHEEMSPKYKQKLKTVFLPILETTLEILPKRNPEEISSASQKLSDFLNKHGYQNPTAICNIVRSLTRELGKFANNPNSDGQYKLVNEYLKNAIEFIKSYV